MCIKSSLNPLDIWNWLEGLDVEKENWLKCLDAE